MHFTRKLPLTFAILGLSTCIVAAQSSTARLASMSSRALCQTGQAVVVTEFIVQGTGSETFVLRGIGPSLGGLGIPDPLQDPTLRFLNPRGKQLDFNNDWMENPDKDEIINVGLAPSNNLESAIIDAVTVGSYTSVLQGLHHGEGVALSEIFDLLDGGLKISAVGTRAFVGTGDDVLISGIVITGSEPLPVLIRVLGPSLADAGLTGVLPDPFLELHSASGELIFQNNNWKDTQEFEIEGTGLAPSNDLESAALVTLDPGAYTVVASGIRGTTGIGFVQYYSLDARARELNPAPIIKRQR